MAGSDFFFCHYCPAGTLEAAIPVRLFGSRVIDMEIVTADGGDEETADAEADEADDLFGDDDEMDMAGGADFGAPDLEIEGDDESDDYLAAGAGVDPVGTPTLSAGWDFWLFSPRMWVLYVFLAAFILFRRPFCRGICPIGAIFALLNRFSLFQMRVKKDPCKACNACARVCPTNNKVYFNPTSQDCIRCLECVAHCKKGAAEIGLIRPAARQDFWE